MLPPDDPRLTPFSLRKDLLASGWSERGLARALKQGHFARVRHGAYVAGDAWARLTQEEKYAVRCRAAYAQARTDVVLTHCSFLPFVDAPMWGIPMDDVHLTRDDNRTGRREAGVRQHRGKLIDGDVVERHGIRMSSATRGALEVITIARPEPALAVVNHLLHSGETTIAAIKERYAMEKMERWPFSIGANIVLTLAEGRLESVGESRCWYLFWSEGLPLPVPQYVVNDARGRFLGRVDFAWPDLGVWVEFDGRVKYLELLREGESATDAVLREKRREDRIAAATGWRCIRLTWADLANPREVVRRIREAAADVAKWRSRA